MQVVAEAVLPTRARLEVGRHATPMPTAPTTRPGSAATAPVRTSATDTTASDQVYKGGPKNGATEDSLP